MKIDAAVLGGVGFSSFIEGSAKIVNTPYGDVGVYIIELNDKTIAIVPRHSGAVEHVPPHMINYRANIWAIKELGVEKIIATNSVGTMKGHNIGSFVIPDDFIDLTKSRISTFYDKNTIHVDMTEPYCPQISKCLMDTLEKKGLDYTRGTYVCTEGPRFETRAEIKMMSMIGDIVGMTGLPEVVLARELELCYASICTITNQACGLTENKITADEVVVELGTTQDILLEVLTDVIDCIPATRECECMNATQGARL
ncbi:methylthioadenosine phosphorylase [Methanococcoides vulcani]|uniref:Probable S-methyl-5'-thioinosine phosphorylase n=1 Tax=Methanococcoides vulcani TaxID=1353158 RepID=A0A1I0AB32_9EURY|nr:MTAP family purine nucleoside phosphorylase [Methanococcoides vulcani]SES91379.1 methylthioadenosine phosphorylase [Methanococcoides vulcani]